MIWWKEWRETRFSFLTTLLFVSGVYYSLPRTDLGYGYFRGIFLMFFAIAMAIIYGSGAMSSEAETETAVFLISKPASRTRLFIAKYLIRAVEVTLVAAVPLILLIKWDDLQMWMWAPPYLFQKYMAFVGLVVLFTYSITFFFSILFKKQAICVLAGIASMGAYFVFRGFPVLQKVHRLERVDGDFLLIILLCITAFVICLIAFRIKEF